MERTETFLGVEMRVGGLNALRNNAHIYCLIVGTELKFKTRQTNESNRNNQQPNSTFTPNVWGILTSKK